MIVLKRKRLVFISLICCLSIFTFLLANNAQNTTEKEIRGNIVETVSLPTSNKVIVLDAGHGVPDEGAENSEGVSEASINLKIALKVQNLLEQSGSTVILTRSDENGIYDEESSTLKQKKISDIKNRVKIGNESSADIFVSIHLNKIPQTQYDGWQTFYKSGDAKCANLAKSIQASLNNSIDRENDRIAKIISDIYIVKNVTIPLAIVECGFLSNAEESKLLQQDEYQDRIAWGIYTGIINYFYENN